MMTHSTPAMAQGLLLSSASKSKGLIEPRVLGLRVSPRDSIGMTPQMEQGKSQAQKLMVVDDESDNLDLLYRTFRRDFRVFRAQSGSEALKILDAEGEMAVIISDQRMPGMSGTEFLSRTVDRFPDTLRIVLTGYTDVADLVEAINSGQVFKYITKPWEPENLKRTVTQAVEVYETVSRRTQDLRRALQRESLFNDIVSVIRESLDYHGMLQTIVETIGTNLGAEVGLLYPWDNDSLVTPPFMFPHGPGENPTPETGKQQEALGVLDQFLRHIGMEHFSAQDPESQSTGQDKATLGQVLQDDRGFYVGLPLTYQKSLLAVLGLYRDRGRSPWKEDELRLLANVGQQAAIAVSQARLYRWSQEQSAKLQAELDMARQIQANLLRQDVPAVDGLRIQACCRPARAVGGDFFEVYVHPQGDVWLAVGDVSGKGVPAALYMASSLSLLRRELTQEISPDPETVIRNLNRSLLQDLVNNNCFVTAVLLRYRPRDRSLAYANAGHIYPMVWQPATPPQASPQYLTTRGIPLGILPEWKGSGGQESLAPGQVLLLTSDGITEATLNNPPTLGDGGFPAMLQQEGFWHLVSQYPQAPDMEQLLDHIQSLSTTQDDDQTLVSLEIL